MIPDINLLPIEKETVSKKRFGPFFLLLLSLAIIIFYGINYFLVNRDVRDLQSKTDALSTQIADAQTQINKMESTPEGILTKSITFVDGETIQLSKIIDLANKYAKGSGELAGFSYEGNNTELILYFDNLNEVSTYVRSLSGESIFNTVQLRSASAFTSVDIDNVDDEKDLEGSARYKAIVDVTLDQEKLQSGGGN